MQAELELGDTDAAGRSVAELAELARASQSRLLWGLLAMSHGALLLAQGDVDRAVPLLREASSTFQHLECPYEVAQVRLALGMAARQADDEETAVLEFEAAAATFTRLGAQPDSDRACALAGRTSENPRR